MPLVFVHGVNNRIREDTAQHIDARDNFFRHFALKGVVSDPAKATVLNPFWGDRAATFAWNHASLPKEGMEAFGSGGSQHEQILFEQAADIQAPAQDQVILTLARKSMERAVDLLWTAGAYTDSGESAGAELAASAGAALEYARANPSPAWLAQVRNDDEFVERLHAELTAAAPAESTVESFGTFGNLFNNLKTTAAEMANSAAAFVVNPAARIIRPWLHHQVSLFIGDIFAYLNSRTEDGGGPIVKEVLGAFRKAEKSKKPGDDKLIIIGHSMGGIISYDLLTSFATDLKVDLFLTVGSQVGVFEELKLFRHSDAALKAPGKVKLPDNIARWINVIDPNDPLAYATSEIFAGATDTKFESDAPVWSSHSSYFVRPRFHERLRARIQGT